MLYKFRVFVVNFLSILLKAFTISEKKEELHGQKELSD